MADLVDVNSKSSDSLQEKEMVSEEEELNLPESKSVQADTPVDDDVEEGSQSPLPGLAMFSEPNLKPLDIDTVVEVLKNVEKYESVACTSAASNPKAGDVFLCIPKTGDSQVNCWKDQYLWVNHGPKAIPAKDPSIQKRYYVAKLSDGRPSKFHKSIYTLLNDTRSLKPYVVQYMGSTEGIATKKNRAQDEKTPETPKVAQDKAKRNTTENQPRLLNMKRPVYVQQKKLVVKKDDAKHLHELAYSLPSYFHSIQIAPTFHCILGLKDLCDHLEIILQTNNNEEEPILFSYSQLFEFSEFVVTAFLFSHIAFDGKPAIPLYFIIHEKEDHSVHAELFRVLQEMVPSIATLHTPIVTEGDLHKDRCIASNGLNLVPIASWKEVFSHAKQWMYANKATQHEVATGLDDLRRLMSSETEDIYYESLDKCKENWGPALQEFYMSELYPVVKTKYGRWNFSQWGIFNPYTGISDKKNDCLEIIMQHLQAWNDVTVTAISTACYLMQHYVRKEIRDGANGIGRFIANVDMNTYKDAMMDWKPIPFLCLPKNIVSFIKEDQVAVQDGAIVEKTTDAKKTLFNKGKQIYESGNIEHNATLQGFVVRDIGRVDAQFLVKLYPRASCSCESTMFCQHIIAVKMSIGIDMESEMERLDMKFVTRALKCCENAAEGIKTRRRRRKRPMATDANSFDPTNKRDCMVAGVVTAASGTGEGAEVGKLDAASEGDEDSDNDNEAVSQNTTRQVDFFSHTLTF
eukprot:gene7022-7810_t